MIGQNLKFLRKRKEISQEEMAKKLGIPRSSYSGYENGVAEPPFDLLIKLADSLNISLDILLREDISAFSENKLSEIENQIDYTQGDNLRILVTTVDQHNEELIELVSESAKAGYSTGYADPEFIKVLPAFNLPFISKQKKCRAFPISGDSMPPVGHGSFVIGEYLENWRLIRDGFPYIVVTKNEGIVFKVIYNFIDDRQSLQLCSTNLLYNPYEISVTEVLEVWKFVNYISTELNDSKPDDAQIAKSLRDLQKEIADLKEEIKLL